MRIRRFPWPLLLALSCADPSGSPRDGGPEASLPDAPLMDDALAMDGLLEAGDLAPPLVVVFNEVDCHGRDWAEVINLSLSEPVDLTGWMMTDNRGDGTHTYTFPPGTTLEPGGLMVVREGDLTEEGLPFGIGCGSDTLWLLQPDGGVADQVDVADVGDERTWGRLPDGTGPWQVTAPTKGRPNQSIDGGLGQADFLYDPLQVVTLDLVADDQALDALWQNPEEYVPATMTLALPDGTDQTIPIGLRLKGGAGSFRDLSDKAAFKVKLDFDDQISRFLGLKHMTLNNLVQDASLVHEALSYTLFRAMDVPAPRVGYAWVRLNGQDYGLYSNVEAMDEVFLASWFASTQHLYEGEYGADVSPWAAGQFEVDQGDEWDRHDMDQLVSVAFEAPEEHWMEAMVAVADLEEMTEMWATEVFVGQWDGYVISFNNFYLHSDDEGRFTMLPWGMDQAWNSWPRYHQEGQGQLYLRCLGLAECRGLYDISLGRVVSVMEGLDLEGLARDIFEALGPFGRDDPRSPYAWAEAQANFNMTLDFLGGRLADLRELVMCLEDPGHDPDGDGVFCDEDCDEGDPTIYQGALDLCGDGLDQDCNGRPDDGPGCCFDLWRGTHRYLLCPQPLSYDMARQTCLAEGADLVMVDGPEEGAWLGMALEEGGGSAWLGLGDGDSEGEWVWVDGTPLGYAGWEPGEPNNVDDNEDCALMQPWGGWNDVPCDGEFPVLCEDLCPPGGEDGDGDGHSRCGADCDDADADTHPGAIDLCGDGIDQDCSGRADDDPACE